MNKKDIKEKITYGDEIKYGEFISSYFAWLPLNVQKKRTKKLENITKDKK